MVQDPSSPRDTEKDEPDILDLKANPDSDARAEAAAATGESPVEDTVTGAESTAPGASAAASTASYGSPPFGSEPASPTPPKSGASTTTLLGAGILGGLIALLAAGSMQYAGYLPGAAPAQTANTSTEVNDLRAEVDGLKQQLSTMPTDAPQTGDLEKRIAALEQQKGNGPGADPEMASKLAALEERLATLQAAASQAETAGNQKFADLSGRLAEAEKTLKDKPGEAAVSKAIAATYLKAAVDRGAPFLTELDTFAALAPDDPAIKDLTPMAANGVKSKAELSDAFHDQAKAIMDALDQPAAGESMTDRLFASARSLISVRPVGNVEGTDAGAILARMEDKLKNGDVKGASLEWDGLPDAGKKVSQDYKAELDKRAKADELTKGLAARSATPAVNAG